MPTLNNHVARAILPAAAAVSCLVAATVAANLIVGFTYVQPQLGDIVAFAPTMAVSLDDTTRLLVRKGDQSACILDLSVLRRSGGSLVIEMLNEAGMDAGTFRTHWAGGRTSDDPGNCGRDAELVVDRQDLDTLALAAGGYGVDVKRMPMIASDTNRF